MTIQGTVSNSSSVEEQVKFPIKTSKTLISKHLLIFLEIVHHSNSTALSEIRDYIKDNENTVIKNDGVEGVQNYGS